MKKFLLSLTLLTMAFASHADYPQWLHLNKYAAANKELQASPNSGRRVIFLGNSITEGWVEKHPEFFRENPDFHGRGISGETTVQFLSRFREDVLNNKPALLVINGGTNDIAENTGTYNADFTFGNIVSMVELAKANGIKVILTSILPAASYSWNPAITDAPEKIKAMNKRLKAYAEKNSIPYVDYYSPMVMDGGALYHLYTNDGVHPLPAGYDVMEGLILPVIKKQLNSK